jgi:hypothetical protein
MNGWQAALFPLDVRTDLSDHRDVRGAEFERRVQKLAQRKKVTYQFVADKVRAAMVACTSAKNPPPLRIGRKKSAGI